MCTYDWQLPLGKDLPGHEDSRSASHEGDHLLSAYLSRVVWFVEREDHWRVHCLDDGGELFNASASPLRNPVRKFSVECRILDSPILT